MVLQPSAYRSGPRVGGPLRLLRPLRPLHPSCTGSVSISGPGPPVFLFLFFPARPPPLTPWAAHLTRDQKASAPSRREDAPRATALDAVNDSTHLRKVERLVAVGLAAPRCVGVLA